MIGIISRDIGHKEVEIAPLIFYPGVQSGGENRASPPELRINIGLIVS